MIPKKTYKIAVNFSKLLISYLAVGALLLLLIMLILNGKVPNFEMICSVYSIIFFVGFMALGGVGLHFVQCVAVRFAEPANILFVTTNMMRNLKKPVKQENLLVRAAESAFISDKAERTVICVLVPLRRL